MANLALYSCVFVFGLIAGSFMNVCIYRIPRGMSVASPRSHCPACGTPLKAYEMIPLAGYALLRGRCSSCGAAIPFRYPLVELASGALCAVLFWKFGASFRFACYAALCMIYTAVFFIDLEWMRIPNVLVVYALIPACALWVEYLFFLTPPERFRSVYNSINGSGPLLGLIPCAAFLLIYAVSAIAGKGKSAIGMGDIKLLIPTGLALGFRQCLLAVFISVILGGLTGAVLLISHKKNKKDPIPFGPFIVVGAIAAIIVPSAVFF